MWTECDGASVKTALGAKKVFNCRISSSLSLINKFTINIFTISLALKFNRATESAFGNREFFI